MSETSKYLTEELCGRIAMLLYKRSSLPDGYVAKEDWLGLALLSHDIACVVLQYITEREQAALKLAGA